MSDEWPERRFAILGDTPNASLDPKADTLGFRQFVEPLAKRLLASKGHAPFTVGVFADWGQGKTTIMRMLEAKLRLAGCPTVWFEPWRYNRRDDVCKGLALTLVKEVKREDSPWREFARKSERIKKSTASALWSWLIGREWASELIEAISTEPWSPSHLHLLEEDLDNLLSLVRQERPDGEPLVLFVDDLDRCLPESALAALEAMKLVLNKRGLITIMGIAEDELALSVRAAYAKQYGESSSEDKAWGKNEAWGKKYLGKMIQMPFPIPAVTAESLNRYIKDCLAESGVLDSLRPAPDRELRREWPDLIRKASGGNLRQVKRFINHYISEIDKSAANAETSEHALGSIDEKRVAFILLLYWRFPDFYKHLLDQFAIDREVFVRYQTDFLSPDRKASPVEIPFIEDSEIKGLFHDCFAWSDESPALVTPFKDDMDVLPYLQFGRAGRREVEREETPRTTQPKTPTTSTEDELDPHITKLLLASGAEITQSQFSEAERILKGGLTGASQRNDKLGEAIILSNLGFVAHLQNDSEKAKELVQKALPALRGTRWSLEALLTLSASLRELGSLKEALVAADEAGVIGMGLDNATGRMSSLDVSGQILLELGHLNEARERFETLNGLATRLGHVPGEISARLALGRLSADQEGPKAAIEHYEEARSKAQRISDYKSESIATSALHDLARMEHGRKDRPALSKEAEELLLDAAKDPHGDVLRSRTLGGLTVETNGKSFATRGESRSEALWEAAVYELRDAGLLQDRGHEGEIFGMTNEGYKVADLLTAQD